MPGEGIDKEMVEKSEKDNLFDSVTKRSKVIVGLTISVFILGSFLIKPLLWPSRLQADIAQLRKEDEEIRKDVNTQIDKVSSTAQHDREMIKKDLEHLKEKVDKVEDMIEFLYLKGGGKAIADNDKEG